MASRLQIDSPVLVRLLSFDEISGNVWPFSMTRSPCRSKAFLRLFLQLRPSINWSTINFGSKNMIQLKFSIFERGQFNIARHWMSASTWLVIFGYSSLKLLGRRWCQASAPILHTVKFTVCKSMNSHSKFAVRIYNELRRTPECFVMRELSN